MKTFDRNMAAYLLNVRHPWVSRTLGIVRVRNSTGNLWFENLNQRYSALKVRMSSPAISIEMTSGGFGSPEKSIKLNRKRRYQHE